MTDPRSDAAVDAAADAGDAVDGQRQRPEPSRELTVLDRTTGEVLDVRAASDEELATWSGNYQDLQVELRDAEAIVSGEILNRLDRNATWTMRVGDPRGDRQYEIKAPSPDAGTKGYDEDRLEATLRELVAEGVIAPAAAEKALRRTVTVTFDVPWDEDLDELVERARQDTRVDPEKGAQRSRQVVAAGVAKLEKVGGVVKERLKAAQITKSAPTRKARVKVIHRGDVR